jgi:hypothetical protein
MTTTGINSLSSTTYRVKFKQANLDRILRRFLIAEKICEVDRTDSYLIRNPYGSQPVAQMSVNGINGTYTVDDYSTTDDSLTVTDEVKVAEQVYDFEQTLSNFDMYANRADEQAYAFAAKIDSFVLNYLGYSATGAYTTPVGGFTTASNVITILSNLQSKVMGYADAYKGTFLVLENTDVTGVMASQANNGFSFADSALNNGLLTRMMGTEIYVTRTSTFTNSAIGTLAAPAMSGCRLFGVNNVATYAAPRGVQVEEKAVSGKTGRECVTWGYVGFKLWTTKAALIVKITLA